MKIKKHIIRIKSFARNISGFTLLEILIGISISSLIMIMVYSSHRSITKAITQMTGVADFYENVNLAIRRIDKDISCMYFNRTNKKANLVGKNNEESPYRGAVNLVTVDHQELSFLADPKLPYPKSDVREVGYSLRQDSKIPDLFFLVRREERHYDDDPEAGGDMNIILENVVDLQFEFRRGNNWIKTWDSRETQSFPKAIRTTLKVRNYSKEEEEFTIVSKINLSK